MLMLDIVSHICVTVLIADLFEFGDGSSKEFTVSLVILLGLYTSYLCQTFEGDVTKHRYIQELVNESGDEGSFKDIAKGNPVEKTK